MPDEIIKPSTAGNRVLIGKSGIPFETIAGVAPGLMRDDPSIRYVDGLEPEQTTVTGNEEIPADAHQAAMPPRAAE